MNDFTALVNHHLYAGINVLNRIRHKCHFRIIPAILFRILKCGVCLGKRTDTIYVNAKSVMQFLDSINGDSDAHDVMILFDKMLGLGCKPCLSIRGKTNTGQNCQRIFSQPALFIKIVTDLLDQVGFQ